jgi:hypothetical protein
MENKKRWWMNGLNQYSKTVRKYAFLCLFSMIFGSNLTFYTYFNLTDKTISYLVGLLSVVIFSWSFLKYRNNAVTEFNQKNISN